MKTQYVLTGQPAGSDEENVICVFSEEPDDDRIRAALAEFETRQMNREDYSDDDDFAEHLQWAVDGYFDGTNGGYISIDEVKFK